MVKLKNNQQYTLTGRQIKKMKQNATSEAMVITQIFPLWIMRNKYGFGEKRLNEFIEHYSQLISAYNEDYLDLEDIARTIKVETGVVIGVKE